jgi:glycosyltransferase involved in cell wall biosynthesis
LRILLAITRYWPAIGGAELHTRELLRSLPSTLQTVVIAHWAENRTDWLLGTTLLAPTGDRSYDDDGRRVHLIALTLPQRLAALPLILAYYPLQRMAAARIGHMLSEQVTSVAGSFDLVHNVRSGREPLSVASLEAARKQGVPFVLTPNHHPRWVGWRYRVYLDLYRQADAVIALTEHERQELVGLGACPDRVHVTGIGPLLATSADPKRARGKFRLPERFVLFLGQKYRYKGIEQLLQAARDVWQRHPEVGFVFVGPRTGHSRTIFRDVRDNRVRELGVIDLQDKTDMLAASELVCVPSSQESFGGVLVEAWAAGKPVIAGPAPASAEVIEDGVDGFFLHEQSTSLIVERLRWLLDNPHDAALMGQRGASKVAARFTWQQIAAKTEAVYRSAR